MDPSLSISIEPPPPIPPPPIPPAVSAAAIVPTVVTSAPAANPTPSIPPSFNHPPYAEMIFEAIGALKEKNGSSKRAIAKYIEGAYREQLPPTHPALLTHHLKRLKNNGQLLMVKKSYKLASSRSDLLQQIPDDSAAATNAAPASTGPKRGRGRPPKPKPASLPPLQPGSDPNAPTQPVLVAVGLADGLPNAQPQADAGKRTPGRPRKNGLLGQARPGRPRKLGPLGPKKSPGRPRKPKSVSTAVGVNGLKRGRGRPPKAHIQVQAQVPGQPQVGMPIPVQPIVGVAPYANSAAAGAPNVPRPRGRPKLSGAGAVAGGVAGKRRGRPPKIGGVSTPMKPKKTAGRPVGRPRKVTEGPEQQALAAAYGDLKRKFEFFQSKISQVVGVLKPQFSSESNISAIGAIQELEGLAAMDIIRTPYREEAQPAQPLHPAQEPPLPQDQGQVS